MIIISMAVFNYVRSIFKSGTSNVVTLPMGLTTELGFVPGTVVKLEVDTENKTILIKKVEN